MAEPWPRNIVPINDEIVRVLGRDRALTIFFAALDGGLRREDLVRVTGRPRADAERTAEELLRAGLLRLEEGVYHAAKRHLRETALDSTANASYRRAMIEHAREAIDDTSYVLRARVGDARVGGGVVTLPDDPETLARMTAILAEAEDQLRALQEERPPASAPRQIRVLMFVGSTSAASPPHPSAPPR